MDFDLELFDFGVDVGKGAGWDVLVEVPGEWDFVADFGGVVVDPCVGDVWEHFDFRVGVNRGAVCGVGESC